MDEKRIEREEKIEETKEKKSFDRWARTGI